MNTIEYMWAVTSYFSIIAMQIITGICFGIFVRPYMKKQKKAISVSVVYTTVMLVLYIIPPEINNFSAYMVGVIIAFAVMCIEDKHNIYQKIFLAITFFTIRWLAVAMAGKIDDLFIGTVVLKASMAERVWLQYGLYVGTRVLDIIFCTFLIAGAVWLINKAFIYKKSNMNIREMVMLIMPSLAGVTEYGILQYYLTIYENDTGKSLIATYGFYGALSFLHYFISIIAILVMIIVFQNWKATQEEQLGQEHVINQINDMKKHIEGVEKIYQDIRSIRHDIGNHIQTIEHLVVSDNASEATEYLRRLRKEWAEVSPEIKSGNPITDVILLEKKKEAEKRKIRFQCDFHYPEETNIIDAFDVSVILNNALDNCLESAGGKLPYIIVSSYRENNIFMISITNSFEGNITIDDDTKLPVSTKKETGHGLGLANIRRVAQMYLGDIAFEQEDKKIVLTIMLQVK